MSKDYVEINENEEVVEVKEGFGTKVVNGFKNHSKTIFGVIAGAVVAFIAGYAVASHNEDDSDYDLVSLPESESSEVTE